MKKWQLKVEDLGIKKYNTFRGDSGFNANSAVLGHCPSFFWLNSKRRQHSWHVHQHLLINIKFKQKAFIFVVVVIEKEKKSFSLVAQPYSLVFKLFLFLCCLEGGGEGIITIIKNNSRSRKGGRWIITNTGWGSIVAIYFIQDGGLASTRRTDHSNHRKISIVSQKLQIFLRTHLLTCYY